MMRRTRRWTVLAGVAAALSLIVVPATARAGLPQQGAWQETLQGLNLTDTDIDVVGDNTTPVGELSFFRFATSATDQPTISLDEAPFAAFDSVSLGHFTWPAGRVPDLASNPGGGLFLPIGQGIQPDTQFVVIVVTLDDDLPTVSEPDSLFKNLSVVFQDVNEPGWPYQGDFVADTWGQGCCIIWTDYGPEPWASHVTTVDSGGNLVDHNDINGFTFFHGDTLVFGADRQQLLGDVPPEQIGTRIATHFHDGSYGACETCRSIITTDPRIDGSDPFTWRTPFELTVGSGPPPVESLPADPDGLLGSDDDLLGSDDDDLLGSDDDSTVIPGDLGLADDSLPDDGSTALDAPVDPPVGTGTPGDPLWPFVAGAGGLMLLGAGEAVRRRAKPRTDPNKDGFLFEALAGLGGEGATTTISAADADHLWTVALGPELQAQDRIARAQAEIVRQWVDWHGRFKAAAVRFAEAFLRAWQGSGALQENQTNWRVNQVAAKAADLAVALIQLVRGAFMLGRGIAGWWRARTAARMAAKSTDEILALRAAAEEALEASPELVAFAESFMGAGRAGLKTYRDELVETIMWGQEAGIDVVKIVTTKLDDLADFPVTSVRKLDAVREVVITQAMAAMNLIEATPAVANAVENCAGVLGTLARQGAGLSDEGAAAVRTFVNMVDETPGFWDDAGNMYVKLARGADPQFTGEMANLANGSTLSSLRALYDAAKASGDDLTRLPTLFRDALGPAKATALSAGGGATSPIPGALMQNGALTVGHGAAMAGTTPTDGAPIQVGAIGSLDAQMHQYGITGDSFGGNMWDFVCGPIETSTGIYHSWIALDELEDVMADHDVDMSEMSSAWLQIVNTLQGLGNLSAGGAAGHDPIEDLESALDDLERAQAGLRDVWNDASPEWRQANKERFDEKMAHIDKKRAAIQRLIGGLRRLKVSIGRLHTELDGMQTTPDGDRRTPLEWIDADLAQALTRVGFQLESISFEVLVGE